MTLILIAGALVVITGAYMFVMRGGDKSDSAAWEGYVSSERSSVARMMARAARPLASSQLIQGQKASQTWKQVEAKLRAGGAFSGSMEVFLSVQALMMFVAIGVLIGVFVLKPHGLMLAIFVLGPLLLVAYPYNIVSTKAKARSEAVLQSLPDFAELLVMVLPNSSVLTSLAFTAERTTGPVSEEVSAMVAAISSRTVQEGEAFGLAAERLGTPEARSFMTTLMNAYLEGGKALDAIKAQSEAMRKKAFQVQREAAKKLPTQLIIVLGLHFMPALFVIALLPVIVGFGRSV